MTVRLSVAVPDPRRASGVKRLPTLWGYALLMSGWTLLAGAGLGILSLL